MVVHADLNRSMVDRDGKASAKLARGRTFIAGLVSGQEESKVARLTEAAVAAFAGLGNIKAFWK